MFVVFFSIAVAQRNPSREEVSRAASAPSTHPADAGKPVTTTGTFRPGGLKHVLRSAADLLPTHTDVKPVPVRAGKGHMLLAQQHVCLHVMLRRR